MKQQKPIRVRKTTFMMLIRRPKLPEGVPAKEEENVGSYYHHYSHNIIIDLTTLNVKTLINGCKQSCIS